MGRATTLLIGSLAVLLTSAGTAQAVPIVYSTSGQIRLGNGALRGFSGLVRAVGSCDHPVGCLGLSWRSTGLVHGIGLQSLLSQLLSHWSGRPCRLVVTLSESGRSREPNRQRRDFPDADWGRRNRLEYLPPMGRGLRHPAEAILRPDRAHWWSREWCGPCS